MNALFGTVIKVFLSLVQADDAVGKDDRDGTDRGDGQGEIRLRGRHGVMNQLVTLILTADRKDFLRRGKLRLRSESIRHCTVNTSQEFQIMEHNFERLKVHILPLSNATDWSNAKNEWRLVGIEVQEDWDHCPCGKEIKELCYIENQLNGNTTYVGNVCVNRFIGIDTGNLFAGLRRIIADETANANEDLIIHAYQFGYIFEKEYQFLMQTRLKRNLSAKQLEWKRKINRRIVNQTVVRKTS